MNKTRRGALKMLVCPEYGRTGTLRKIIYGMPDPETFDNVGKSCTKLKSAKTVSGVKFVCVKEGKNLVWAIR